MTDPDGVAALLRRVRRLVEETLRPAMNASALRVPVSMWETAGEPVSWRVAVSQDFLPIEKGEAWGRPWGTAWFRLDLGEGDGSSPTELVVDLGFDHDRPGFQSEATAWDDRGRILKAVEPMNARIRLVAKKDPPGPIYLEASANPNLLFAADGTGTSGLNNSATPLGDRLTAPSESLYRFGGVLWRPIEPTLTELIADVEVLEGILRVVADDSRRHARICAALRDMLDLVDPRDPVGCAPAARRVLEPVLAASATASSAILHAVGHAHIDSAWLWPLRETRRKVVRTFANVVALMDDDPDLTFVATSAQQFAWLEADAPELFERVAQKIREGRFFPVGGMWVESDTNLPSGESLVRQFVEGTRYFLDRFEIETDEVWLPDSFGYTGAFPQIAAAAGKRRALIQKVSWNDTNRIPASTFTWESRDGSRLLAHLPSVDIYNTDLRAEDLVRAERQLRPRAALQHTLVPFGYGDGGGGPTPEMLARGRRSRSLEGLPRVRFSTPATFFEAAEAEGERAGATWVGELYLEYHRGTYTSQRAMKVGNRGMERLLARAELASAAASLRVGAAYPYDELQRLWRATLLLQFHDILPGTSIAWVHREAREQYAREQERAGALVTHALAALPDDAASSPPAASRSSIREADGLHILANDRLVVVVDERGLVTSVRDLVTDRELVPPDGVAGLLQVHPDTPGDYDAWELDSDYTRVRTDLLAVDAIASIDDGEGCGIEVTRSHGRSRFRQRYLLRHGGDALEIRTEVDWQETRTLLKLAIALDEAAEVASFGTQFGHIDRPTIRNTSWDRARFEVPAHGFVWVGTAGQGIAVCSDAVYGHDVSRQSRSGGGSSVQVRLSLLRAPRFPDPHTDAGRHILTCSIRAAADVCDARAEAERLETLAIAPLPAAAELVSCADRGIVITAVKLADDRSGDLVVRLCETLGRHTRTRLQLKVPARAGHATDALERPLDAPELAIERDALRLELRPFELATLRFRIE
ncbi:alpha-mannosidase [Jiangella endophytica]|uniref:alpha-mannosidase n=1 Tax=Jiangella endophytica TaxID=1623398 RepID=UPI0018E5412D|nr:glycoside hydrolase family 38 C-terminal domain-containing protein [Jiangella endophytica]